MGGYFASSRHGGEGRISEKNTTLRVVFLERATRLELASRHPTNGCRHSQEPCLTSDQTCFAQVEAATSSLPAVSFQKRKSHPDGWDFLFWSGRRGSNSLPRPWQGRALPDELRPQMTPMFQRHGASGRSRTNDTRIFSPLLYQLSYLGKCRGTDGTPWRRGRDLNPRPPA